MGRAGATRGGSLGVDLEASGLLLAQEARARTPHRVGHTRRCRARPGPAGLSANIERATGARRRACTRRVGDAARSVAVPHLDGVVVASAPARFRGANRAAASLSG